MEDVREEMREMGVQMDPVREALRKMIAEFHDYHYHGCPADNDSGPCECFAGALLANARSALSPVTQALGDVVAARDWIDMDITNAALAA